MKDDCECRYCKAKMNEYFCCCGNNFNVCEIHWEIVDTAPGDLPVFGTPLCPKCHPRDYEPTHPGVKRVERT